MTLDNDIFSEVHGDQNNDVKDGFLSLDLAVDSKVEKYIPEMTLVGKAMLDGG